MHHRDRVNSNILKSILKFQSRREDTGAWPVENMGRIFPLKCCPQWQFWKALLLYDVHICTYICIYVCIHTINSKYVSTFKSLTYPAPPPPMMCYTHVHNGAAAYTLPPPLLPWASWKKKLLCPGSGLRTVTEHLCVWSGSEIGGQESVTSHTVAVVNRLHAIKISAGSPTRPHNSHVLKTATAPSTSQC